MAHPHLELRIFGHLADATPASEIAKRLGITESTVRAHIRHLQEKLNVRGMPEVIGWINWLATGTGQSHSASC